MDIWQFNSKSKTERWEILCTTGFLVGEAMELDSSFLLYAVDSFYVELEFSLQDGRAQNINAITDNFLLEKYLRKILLILA